MNERRQCCRCGGDGPFVRVVTCQDARGEVFDHLCLCETCDELLSDDAFRAHIRAHIDAWRATMRGGTASPPPDYGIADSTMPSQ